MPSCGPSLHSDLCALHAPHALRPNQGGPFAPDWDSAQATSISLPPLCPFSITPTPERLFLPGAPIL